MYKKTHIFSYYRFVDINQVCDHVQLTASFLLYDASLEYSYQFADPETKMRGRVLTTFFFLFFSFFSQHKRGSYGPPTRSNNWTRCVNIKEGRKDLPQEAIIGHDVSNYSFLRGARTRPSNKTYRHFVVRTPCPPPPFSSSADDICSTCNKTNCHEPQ